MSEKITDVTISKFLQERSKTLSGYMPDHARKKHESWLRTAMMTISDNENLKKCLETPSGQNSILHALKLAASVGLSLNPLEGKSALIAYDGKCTFQIMKNGIIELANNSGQVKFITCDTVRKNDKFLVSKTMDGDRYEFTPALTDRGEIIGFFAAVKLISGESNVSYMTKKEVEEHRDRYSKFKGEKAPWTTSFEGMGLKTILKRLFRNVHISDDVSRAVGADDVSETQEPVGTSAEDLTDKIQAARQKPVEAEIVEPVPDKVDTAKNGKMFE